MTYDQISEYLKSGNLDRPDPELDVYRHLRPGQTVAEGLTELTVTETPTTASTVNEVILDLIDEIPDLPTVPNDTPLNYRANAHHIELATVEELVEALKPIPSSKPSDFVAVIEPEVLHTYQDGAVLYETGQIVLDQKSHRGRKTQYDVSKLAVGQYLVYNGIFSSARVMASLKGKAYGREREFRATEDRGEIHIIRVK